MSDGSFDTDRDYFAATAQTYDRLQPIVAGPAYRAGLDFMLALVPHEADNEFVFVELGCGTASLTQAVLARFPMSTAVAIDSEPAMLEMTRRKLIPYGERVEVREADAAACDLPSCNVVLSSFMLHHVPPDGMPPLFSRIASVLSPGGCFIALDTMRLGPAWSDSISAQSRRIYERHVAAAIAAGLATQAEIDSRWALKRSMKEAGKDVEYSHRAEDIVAQMAEAGFCEAGIVWRQFASTVLTAFAE